MCIRDSISTLLIRTLSYSPNLANETPNLANETPNLANETPNLANETPTLANENPYPFLFILL